METEETRLLRGELFAPGAPELKALKRRAHELSRRYNALSEDDAEARGRILAELLRACGEGTFLQGPVFFHYGVHTAIGRRCFFNYDTVIQDDALVTIGDDNNFGPRLTIVTPLHPLLPDERRFLLDENGERRHLCHARPVVIGNDCWFGAGVTVCPGVTIGDGCVIGAGAVVTHDIPARSLAAGVPCKPLRPLTDADSLRHSPELLGRYHVEESHA